MGGRSRVNYRKISEISNGKFSRVHPRIPPKGASPQRNIRHHPSLVASVIGNNKANFPRRVSNRSPRFRIITVFREISTGRGEPFLFFSSFSTGRSFTGNIAKFIGLRFAMIFYASRPVVGAGPPMAGPSTSPHTFGPRGRGTEQASKEAEGERDVRHNLAIIPLFIPVRLLLSGHLNLLNTRRLVHFIKPRVCTRTIHFHLALVSFARFFLSLSFFFLFLFFSFFLSSPGERWRNKEHRRMSNHLHDSTGMVANPIRDRGPRDTFIRYIKLDVMIVARP